MLKLDLFKAHNVLQDLALFDQERALCWQQLEAQNLN